MPTATPMKRSKKAFPDDSWLKLSTTTLSDYLFVLSPQARRGKRKLQRNCEALARESALAVGGLPDSYTERYRVSSIWRRRSIP